MSHFLVCSIRIGTNDSYSIGDIIDALVDFCKSNKIKSKRAYVWICYLCVNQHRVAELAEQKRSGMLLVSALDFFGLYGERVAENGHVLAMMALRNNPDNLKQVWCIFELYTAHTKRCELTIVMPPAQKATLEEAMFGEESRNIDTLYGVLAED
jgi:hypothetical protein